MVKTEQTTRERSPRVKDLRDIVNRSDLVDETGKTMERVAAKVIEDLHFAKDADKGHGDYTYPLFQILAENMVFTSQHFIHTAVTHGVPVNEIPALIMQQVIETAFFAGMAFMDNGRALTAVVEDMND
jgi:hypothetical protein